VIQAPKEKLERLAELKHREKERQSRIDVFAAMAFEPNCKVRQAAAEEQGYPDIISAVKAMASLPPNCHRCPQERFLDQFNDAQADHLYGGAAGGSKSTSLLFGSIRACQMYPGLQAFWFRRTFPELDKSVLRLLARYRFAQDIGAKWNAGKYELTFTTGSILTFGHAANLQDATSLLSAEIQLLLLDERTTIQPDVVEYLYTRVRSGIPGLPCLGIRSATNPGNIGHAQVKEGYVEATEYGAFEIPDDASHRKRSFIQAKIKDTPQLGEEYERTFDGLSEALQKAFKDGDWDVFAGQVFSEFRRERHVIRPILLPKEWRRGGGVDWGHRAPSGVVFTAEDEDKRIWVYDEIYQAELGEKGLADAILAKQGNDDTVFDFDPSMASKIGDARPVAAQLQDYGVKLLPANNDRLSGWQRIHTYLGEAPACTLHRHLGWKTCPMLHVFDNCKNLIRTLPAVVYNTVGRLEDVDTEGDDHLPDALRYHLIERGMWSSPIYPDEPETTIAPDGSPLLPVVPGLRIAGDLGSGLERDEDQDQSDNGKVAASPFV
jgi:hypothetical protein